MEGLRNYLSTFSPGGLDTTENATMTDTSDEQGGKLSSRKRLREDLNENQQERQLQILSTDMQPFSLPWGIALRSGFLRMLLDPKTATAQQPIPLKHQSCTAQTLKSVFEFMRNQNEFEGNPHTSDVKRGWGERFSNFKDEELQALALAADYLELTDLLDLTRKTIGERTQHCSLDEIKHRFNLPGNLLPARVVLVASDQEEVYIPWHIALRSTILQQRLEAAQPEIESNDYRQPLPESCSALAAEKTKEFLAKHHEFDETGVSHEEQRAWDETFVEVEDELLFSLILMANEFEIKDLLDVACKKVAEHIKQCKTPEEIRQRFHIPNDFTPEEEEEVRRENAWLEEV